MDTHEVTLATLPEQRAAVLRGHVDHERIGEFLGAAFSEVIEVLVRSNQLPAGPPLARYHVSDDGGFDIEAGFPVREPIPQDGHVETVTLPGGPVAKVLHKGAYSEVAGAYADAERWIIENGFRPREAPWETYLDGPEVPEPRTEVFMPCTEAHS